MNFNSPPSGFMAQIAWCIEGLQTLSRRVNGLANSSGGSGTYVPYTGADQPVILGTIAPINDATNNLTSIVPDGRVLLDENGKTIVSWTNGDGVPNPALKPLAILGDVDGTGNGTIVKVDDTNQTILLQGTIVKATSLATGTVIKMVNVNNLGILDYQDIPTNGIVTISADLTAQNDAVPNIIAYPVVGNHTYRVGGYVTITAVTVDILGFQVAWVDTNSNTHTRSFYPLGVSATSPNLATARDYEFATMDIRAKDGTSITIATTLITSGGTITYDVGASITLIS